MKKKNIERAKRIDSALRGYFEYQDGLYDTDKSANASDLLTDLMHWCQAHKVDFQFRLALAKDSYESERKTGEAY